MSQVKISLFWQEKLKSRKISNAWLVCLMYDGKDLKVGTMVLFFLFLFIFIFLNTLLTFKHTEHYISW